MENNNSFLMNSGKAFGCHQKAHRSFQYKGKQWFLCARCSGIFIAQIFLIVPLYLLDIHFGFYTLIFAIPLIIDGTVQRFTRYESNNIKRLITGLLGGYGFGIAIIHTLISLYKIFF